MNEKENMVAKTRINSSSIVFYFSYLTEKAKKNRDQKGIKETILRGRIRRGRRKVKLEKGKKERKC